jgi:flagellar basal-body rod protein FlgB
MSLLDNPGFRLLERSMDAAALRQKIIANNIANVDTPRFKRSEVRFEELLRRQSSNQKPLVGFRTDPRHFYIGGPADELPFPQVVSDEKSIMNNNLNNVDIDYEMAQMAANQLRYYVLVQEAGNEIRRMRTAIDGRR